MINKIYARANEKGIVTHIFSEAFEKPLSTDLLINDENEDRQGANKYQVIDEQGIYNYEIKNGKMVERDKTQDLINLKSQERERERIVEYKWVDDQVSKCEREKLLPNADLSLLQGKITTLRTYANNVWATQQQAQYPQTVEYPERPIKE